MNYSTLKTLTIISFIITGIIIASTIASYAIAANNDSEQPYARPQIVTERQQQIQNPNDIKGLEAVLSEYQVFITYTPEPGAEVLRVEYQNSFSGEMKSAPIDIPCDYLLGNQVSATLQRDVGEGIRITIIYDNNVIKFVEFKT